MTLGAQLMTLGAEMTTQESSEWWS